MGKNGCKNNIWFLATFFHFSLQWVAAFANLTSYCCPTDLQYLIVRHLFLVLQQG